MTDAPPLRPDQYDRYRRHLTLPEFGLEGQQALLDARVLLIGMGGLGCPLAQYLAAAGVGTLGLVDFDVVDASNLQRQLLYGVADIGRPKLDVAVERIHALNPDVQVDVHRLQLDSGNAMEILAASDGIVDGTAHFPTRNPLHGPISGKALPVGPILLVLWLDRKGGHVVAPGLRHALTPNVLVHLHPR